MLALNAMVVDRSTTRLRVEEEGGAGNHLVIRMAEAGDQGAYVCQVGGGEVHLLPGAGDGG